MSDKKGDVAAQPTTQGLNSPLAQLVMGASAAIAGGILAGAWALKRKKN